jgi:hypothetical protein
LLLSATLVAVVVAACDGTNDPIARFDNVTYRPALYAINGSPIGAPTAINTAIGSGVRPDASYDFDVAFDLDDQNRPVLYTQRRIGRPVSGAGRQVSLQPVTQAFDDVERAPETQWVADSVLTVTVGQVAVVRVVSVLCQFDLSPYVFSKFVVDSIHVSTRRIWVTALTNPNCGFRSLQPGRPRN